MSDMELNKGKLIPVEMNELIAEKLLAKLDPVPEWGGLYSIMDCFDDYFHNEYVEIGDQWYKVDFKIKKADCYGIEYAKTLDDGSIDFLTYHYNGGGHWTEIVESALKHEGEIKLC